MQILPIISSLYKKLTSRNGQRHFRSDLSAWPTKTQIQEARLKATEQTDANPSSLSLEIEDRGIALNFYLNLRSLTVDLDLTSLYFQTLFENLERLRNLNPTGLNYWTAEEDVYRELYGYVDFQSTTKQIRFLLKQGNIKNVQKSKDGRLITITLQKTDPSTPILLATHKGNPISLTF